MNLNQLRTFYEVAKNLSFSIAAKKLFLTQPAVSIQVKQLEEDLGIKLFRKVGQKIQLSEAGKVLYSYAHQIFRLDKEAEQAISDLKNLKRGLLSIGTTKTYAKYTISPFITRFHSEYPNVKVILHEGSSSEMVDSLFDSKIEIALAAQVQKRRGLELIPFRKERLVLISSFSHPLAQRDKVNIRDLAHEPIIMREEGSGTRSVVLKLFEENGIKPFAILQTSNVDFIKEMVMDGEAVSFVVDSAIEKEVTEGKLKIIPIEGIDLFLNVSIVFLEGELLSHAARVFLNILKEGRILDN